MNKLTRLFLLLLLIFSIILTGCNTETAKEPAKTSSGILQFTANGEDFIRQGFVTKDDWNLTFDHVYITLSEITAYQTQPPYEPEKNSEIKAKEIVKLDGVYTVDLAEGDEVAVPIFVGEVKDIPLGHYNAISWNMVKAVQGEFVGDSLVMIGKAIKDSQTIDFTIQLNPQYNYRGGEYIGDERKGFVTDATPAGLEMTFHFDHLFGDGSLPATDDVNIGAFGFEPFAKLSKDGKINVGIDEIKSALTTEQYENLMEVFTSFGHVGEGHCYSQQL